MIINVDIRVQIGFECLFPIETGKMIKLTSLLSSLFILYFYNMCHYVKYINICIQGDKSCVTLLIPWKVYKFVLWNSSEEAFLKF